MPQSIPLAPLDNESLRAYSATVDQAFQVAVARNAICERCFRIAGYTVCVRAIGGAILACMTRALAHLSTTDGPPDLTIHLWDSVASGAPPPLSPLAWYSQQFTQRGVDQFEGQLFEAHGELAAFNTPDVRTAFHVWPNALQTLDLVTNRGYYWIQDAAAVPYYETSAPFARLLAWWMSERDRLFVHAGAVGTPAGGVLLVGEPGVGKSTSALACLGSALGYAGDDYCLVRTVPSPHVHSLYATAKLKGAADIQRFRHLSGAVVNLARLESEKALLFLHPDYAAQLCSEFPVRAILLPMVSDRVDARLTRVGPADTLRGMAPSTLRQQPGSGRSAWAQMTQLVRQIPGYRLDVGADLASIPKVIEELL